jgi:aldose 1-epimerase
MTRYTLTNAGGASASFMPLGAAVLTLEVPDRDGALSDVVLGYDTAADYSTDNSPYIGLTIGRYASRIAGTRLTLDGETFYVAPWPRCGMHR